MKSLFRNFAVPAIVAFAATLSSCSKGSEPPQDPTPPPATTTPVISITTQPAAPSTALVEGAIPAGTQLTVAASVTGGATLSYQWYSNTTAANTGGTAISAATAKDYTLPADLAAGTHYYYCVVGATGGATSKPTNAVTVTVTARPVPVISIAADGQPEAPAALTEGSIPADTKLTVTASVTEGAALSYQWYTYDPVEDELFEAIEGAISASYTLPTGLTAGSHYYVCELSAPEATPVQTDPVQVTVNAVDIAISDPQDKEQPAYADEGASKGFSFTARQAWTATVEEVAPLPAFTRAFTRASSGVSWLRLKVNGEEMYSGAAGEIDLAIELDVNYTGTTRSAAITIASGTNDIMITVTQQGTTEQGEVPELDITRQINNPARGSVAVTDAQENPVTSARMGAEVTVTAAAESGSEFYYWKAFRKSAAAAEIILADDTANPMTFTIKDYDVEFVAVFIDDVRASSASDAVTINGVRWATRNVDAPGTFAADPESYGMYYRWNKPTGWAAGDAFPTSSPESVFFSSDWSSQNDPCPEGWRMPTYDEMGSLQSTGGLSPREWITLNGIRGMRLVDETTGNAVFLPAAGSRSPLGASYSDHLDNTHGYYWTNQLFRTGQAQFLVFTDKGTNHGGLKGYPPGDGHTIRCVR